MKRVINRFTSLALALAMMLSLSVTVFAADYATVPVDDSKITVTLKVVNKEDNTSIDKTVSIPDNTTIYTLLTKYNHEGTDGLTGAEKWTVDGSTSGGSWFMSSMTYGGKTYATKPSDTPPAGFKGNPDDWDNGYGLVSAKPDEDEYNYYYAGWAWMYDVTDGTLEPNQNPTNLAMNQFKLHAGNVVTLTYALQTSEWTTDEPYSEDYPYLPVKP